MTDHQQLKEINDLIGFDIKNSIFRYCPIHNNYYRPAGRNETIANVREIIFTQEFMDKLAEYYCNQKKQIYIEGGRPIKIQNVIHHLNNTTEYLYNLLGLGKQTMKN